jgi:exosortase
MSDQALRMRSRTFVFFLWTAFVVALSWSVLRTIMKASLEHGYSSHIVLIPLIAAYLIWSGRKNIFTRPSSSLRAGLLVAGVGILGFFSAATIAAFTPGVTPVAAKLLAVFVMVAGGFIASYGAGAFKAAIFPFLLLLLMMPLPTIAIEWIVNSLQAGSAELAYRLFLIVGVPVHREGFLLHLPGVTIEVAKECSGINSSIALLITLLLVACETLRTTSRRVILLLLAIPLSLVKNAVRIVTLTLLSLYVDPSFLTGKLHHQGGFVFYLVALAIMYPVWKLLQTTEQSKASRERDSQPLPSRSLSRPPVID